MKLLTTNIKGGRGGEGRTTEKKKWINLRETIEKRKGTGRKANSDDREVRSEKNAPA